jgi:hypothetical protein
MATSRLQRILSRLSAGEDPSAGMRRLCEVAAEITATNGAGIMLAAGELPQGSLCSTDRVSGLIEELQYTLGEGPCVDAHTTGTPVLEPDLAVPEHSRWHGFAPLVTAAGARAVFGFPVRVGAARLGSLDLYRDHPGPLTDDQHADALVMADVVASAILAMQANAPPGSVAAELEAGANFQFVVHQAAGMVSIQLDTTVGEALVRLRAYAFGCDRPIADVARDVVSRQLDFNALEDD